MNRIVATMLLALTALGATRAAAQPPSEYEVKAAFLLNFARLVTWPEGAFAAPEQPLVVATYGEDPFDGALGSLLEGHHAEGRPLRAEAVLRVEHATAVHVLFVPRSHAKRLPELVEQLADAPVLLVGESEGFAVQGGVINLYEQDGRIRFEINRQAAEERGLKLSSRLLRLARLVGTESP